VEFDVVIEIPKGQRNKYEMDQKTGRIRLDRTPPGACARRPAHARGVQGRLGRVSLLNLGSSAFPAMTSRRPVRRRGRTG
jgi:hypothetical protein